MRIPSTLWFGLAAEALLAVPALAAPLSPESQKVYDTKVKPFLKAHCTKCHDDKVTRAGFRIDTLDTDFLAGKTPINGRKSTTTSASTRCRRKRSPDPVPKQPRRSQTGSFKSYALPRNWPGIRRVVFRRGA
jgi:hypothetical protein